MDRETKAVAALQQLGLTEYEARCFVSLVQVSDASAAELSELSDIPRSRVYDTAESLAERGLIEVNHGSTKRYTAVPVGQTIGHFEREYLALIDELEDHLAGLASSRSIDEQGMWSLRGRQPVLSRAQSLISEAEEAVFLTVTTPDLLVPECLEQIARAHENGVDLTVVSESREVHELFDDVLPDVDISTTSVDWLGLPVQDGVVGRVLMVDRRAIMIATIGNESPTGESEIHGVWAKGENAPLVTIIRQMVDRDAAER